MKTHLPTSCLFPLAALSGGIALPSPASASGQGKIHFNDQVRPILNRHCTTCHGGVKQAGGVSFIDRESALGKGKSGARIVVPGKPDESELVYRITTKDEDDVMPPPEDHPEGMEKEEIEILTEWVKQGAQWDEHWAFVAPKGAPLPQTQDKGWAKQPLDRYVLARLESESLEPSLPASATEWLRRTSFDLTGLPPSDELLEKMGKGAADDKTFAGAVDELLASPAFGERWASLWMDLARYADSAGFEKDPHRNIWPYRDWLIRAFNADMPFDQFTVKQLAGDLLESPAPDDIIATAFHRNTMTNTEGGTDDEEFRVAAVTDRINTTWTVWQGMTFGCVQCHSHPYLPFEQKDYYRFMTFYNSTEDCDLGNEYPVWNLPNDPAKKGEALALDRKVAKLLEKANAPGRDLAGETQDWAALSPTKLEPSHGKLTHGKDGQVRFSGTIPTRAHYRVVSPARELTALRVGIFPDSDNPKDWPERGSVLSLIQLQMQIPGQDKPVNIPFKEAFADHMAGPYEPSASLKDNRDGFGGYPKLFGPRWVVFVPEKPVEPQEGAEFAITLKMNHSTTGAQATPIRRFTLSTSKDPRWTVLANSKQHLALKADIQSLRKTRGTIKGTNVPVMQERPPGAGRPTYVFVRGNRLDRGERQEGGVPGVLPQIQASSQQGRLAMAKWLVAKENPLTARVFANRLWAELFGTGIVETQEDFGPTGTPPSHPALLDYLAVRLRDKHGWRIKPLLREIVLSSTYRQSNQAGKALRERDPRNRLLARGPATRLTAEMVRDQALAVSGLISEKQFGPSVMPPQPDGVWQTVYSGAKWKTPDGPDRYRRALYTYWRRTSPYPSFLIFDAPSREVCTPRRIATNTPLHALVTLNDPVYLECAQALAKRMRGTGGGSPREQISWGIGQATQKEAKCNHVDSLLSLYEDATESYKAQPEEAKALADSPEDAALVLVANTILNLDAAMKK